MTFNVVLRFAQEENETEQQTIARLEGILIDSGLNIVSLTGPREDEYDTDV